MVWYRVNVKLAGSVPTALKAQNPGSMRPIFVEMDKKGRGVPFRGLKIAQKPAPGAAQLCDLRASALFYTVDDLTMGGD